MGVIKIKGKPKPDLSKNHGGFHYRMLTKFSLVISQGVPGGNSEFNRVDKGYTLRHYQNKEPYGHD